MVTYNIYKAGSTVATLDFISFFNEIKDIFINMGHTYVAEESETYKHVFQLNPIKYIYCGYEAKLTITLPSTIYDYLMTDSLPTTGTSIELTLLNYILTLNNGFSTSCTMNFSNNNNYADFLSSNIPRYQTFREIQTDSIYNIMMYAGNIERSTVDLFSSQLKSSTSSSGYIYSNITSVKYVNFVTETENDMTYIFNTLYSDQNMIKYTFSTPIISTFSSVKILTSPLWLSYSNDIRGYVKDLLVTSTIEPYNKYKINNVSYVPLDGNQHYLIKE